MLTDIASGSPVVWGVRFLDSWPENLYPRPVYAGAPPWAHHMTYMY